MSLRPFSIAAFAGLLAAASLVHAATGSLDPAFGTGGTVTTATNGNGAVNALYVISGGANDGAILAAGANGDNFGVGLYDKNGTIQSSYGGSGANGIATENIGPPGAAQAIVLRSDRLAWVAGGATGFALARFSNVGSQGHVRLSGTTYWGYGLALLPNDGALVTGESGNGRGTCALAAFDNTGVLIDGFGTHGVTVSSVGRCEGVIRLDDGHIVVPVNQDANATDGFGIARFTDAGVLDDGFGTHGVTLAVQDSSAFAHAIVRQPSDGKYVVVGQVGLGLSTPKSILAVRFNTDGSVDHDFGVNGIFAVGLTGTPIGLVANAVALDAAGNILIGGTATGPSQVKDGAGPGAFIIIRLLPNGLPDLSFGDDGAGVILTGFGTGSSAALNALWMQSDGKLLAGGKSCVNGQCGFALARYVLNPPVAVTTTTTTLPGGGGSTSTTLPATGCEGQPGLDGLRCLCAQGVNRNACVGQPLRAQIGTLFGKACSTIEKAAAASKVALAKRQYTKARGLLKKTATVTRHQAHLKKKSISADCDAALQASFTSGETLIDGVKAGLQK